MPLARPEVWHLQLGKAGQEMGAHFGSDNLGFWPFMPVPEIRELYDERKMAGLPAPPGDSGALWGAKTV